MLQFVLALLAAVRVFFRSRRDTALEILAMRHQIGVLQRAAKKRPKLRTADRILWAWLSGD